MGKRDPFMHHLTQLNDELIQLQTLGTIMASPTPITRKEGVRLMHRILKAGYGSYRRLPERAFGKWFEEDGTAKP